MSAKVKTHDQRKKAHRPKGPWLNWVFIGMLTFCFGLLTFIFEGFVLRDIETIRQPDWETIPPQASSGQPLQDEPYSCPSCGTTLFEDCRQCGHSRHSLLPHCSHCGEGSEDEVVKHDLKGTET